MPWLHLAALERDCKYSSLYVRRFEKMLFGPVSPEFEVREDHSYDYSACVNFIRWTRFLSLSLSLKRDI